MFYLQVTWKTKLIPDGIFFLSFVKKKESRPLHYVFLTILAQISLCTPTFLQDFELHQGSLV